MEITEYWFFKQYIPDFRDFQVNVLHIHPDYVKTILILDYVPLHHYAERVVISNGKICVVFLLPNTSFIQPMNQGIIAACKRYYQRHYLNELLVIFEEPKDLEEDTR